MFRLLLPVVLLATITAFAAQPSTATIPPTAISLELPNATLQEVVKSLSQKSGVPIAAPAGAAGTRCPVAFAGVPFWDALEQVARKTGNRVVLHDRGAKVALEPRGASREVVAASGPFRIAAVQVIGRELLDLGATVYDVGLKVNWEPRMPVFRIDSQPRITRAIDDRGTALIAPVVSAGTYPTGAMTEMNVRLTGLTRESKRIAVLEGEFKATAAERLLTLKFDDLTAKLPIAKMEERVTVTLHSFTKEDNLWEAKVSLLYPAGHPVFESFEEQKWLRDNRLQLVTPAGKPVEAENEEVTPQGRSVVAVYRFPGSLAPMGKGWSLVYETPSPLIEVAVPFVLKDLPLP